MKTILKDAQVTLRFNKDMLEAMKEAASSRNISLSDFIAKMFSEKDKTDDMEQRLKNLEYVVYQKAA